VKDYGTIRLLRTSSLYLIHINFAVGGVGGDSTLRFSGPRA
jgi:hypothetical protein